MKIGYNVGSGQRKFQSMADVRWINVDTIARLGEEPDIVADGASIPCDSATADYFVLHHVLEHFGMHEGVALLQEAFRMLKPGGSLLIFVPDMRALAQRWLMRKGMDDQLYLTNVYGTARDEFDRHRWGFTRGSLLNHIVASAKWAEVKDFDWRRIPGADIAQDWWILGAEAIR